MGRKITKTENKIKVHKTISNRTNFFYHACRTILIIGLLILVISSLVLSHSSFHSSAVSNASTDNLTLSIPVSCTLSASIKSGEEHTISMVSGKYEADVGKTTLNTICNDPNGYVVYAIGNSGNTEGNNKLRAINLSEDNDIVSGIATSGNTSNWTMKLTALDSGIYTPTIDNNYNTYSIVPTTWTKVAHKSPSTTDTTKDSAFTTTYAIYLESSQPAGTYSGQVKYVMLHPATAAEPTDTLEHAFALAGKAKVDIYDEDDTNTTSSTNSTTGEANTLIGSFYKMQDMETSICESTTLVDEQNTLQLVDIRDNKLYWVTKLQDGHCWMTQNLDLDLSSSVALTSETTDLNDSSLTGAYKEGYGYNPTNGIISWVPMNSTYSSINRSGFWNNDDNIAYSLDPGEWYWNGDIDSPDCQYLNQNTTCTDFSRVQSTQNEQYPIGNYYNWPATIASNNSISLTHSTYNDVVNSPQNSICPKGWRLPIISGQNEATDDFSRLRNSYGNLFSKKPLYFTRAGIITGKIAYYSGSTGYYWSSTVTSDKSAYNLMFSKTATGPKNTYLRYLGMPVRCIAR